MKSVKDHAQDDAAARNLPYFYSVMIDSKTYFALSLNTITGLMLRNPQTKIVVATYDTTTGRAVW